jgi:hypothetical protein
MPSTPTPEFRSTRNQRGNVLPIPATCICTASFSLLSSSSADLPVRPVARSTLRFQPLYHLLQHCFSAQPGTNAAIAAQFSPPCVCTVSFSLMASTAVHLPVRLVVASMLGFKAFFHLSEHVMFVRPGTSATTTSQYNLILVAPLLLGGIRNCTSQLCIFVCCPAASRPSTPGIRLRIRRHCQKADEPQGLYENPAILGGNQPRCSLVAHRNAFIFVVFGAVVTRHYGITN